MNRPLLICLSCTRNYAWVTRCFLEINTRWADYIIIVDQMSTDATRPLIKEYNEKRGDGIHRAEIVIVNDPDMSYKEADRARMAINRAREIEGDKILFYLDIDEILPANYAQTDDWRQILESKPGAMFNLQWANILPDRQHYQVDDAANDQWMHRVLHDDGVTPYDVTGQIHVPLLPWVGGVKDVCLENIPILHFGLYHEAWTYAKVRYYQMVDLRQRRTKSLVTLYRQYHIFNMEKNSIYDIPNDWLYKDVDIFDLIDIVSLPIFCQYMKDMIVEDGIEKYAKLDIWEPRMLTMLQIDAPNQGAWKVLYAYLRHTQRYRKSVFVKIIDKILKRFV